MPGIFEADSTTNNIQPEPSATPSTTPSTSEANKEMQTEPEETPVREVTQTDRMNKFLLKSFLEHINTSSIAVSNESDEQGSNDGNSDWS